MSAAATLPPAPACQPQDDRRTHRSLASWAAGVISALVVSGFGFIATPLLVRWLGDGAWGAWTVVVEWMGYLGLGSMALGPGAMTVFLLRAHTSGQPGALTAMARRGFRIYLWSAVALAPAAVALAWWAPAGLHASSALLQPLRWAVALAALGGVGLAPTVLFRGVLETVQRGYYARAALLAQSLLITALSLCWVWMGWGLVGMAAASVAGMAVGGGLWWWWARHWVPGWRRTPPVALRARELWRVNWPLMLAMAGNQINLFTDNTVVGLSLGAAAVTGFALTQALPLLAGNRLADIGGVSWAALGELRASGGRAFGDRVVEITACLAGAAMVLMATAAVLTPAFVTLWVGASHFDGRLLAWATAAAMVVGALLSFFGWLLDTQGDTRRRLPVSLAGAALNLGLSLWWVRVWGVAGVALATLVAYLATDAWFLPRLVVREYGVPGAALARALLGALLRGGIWVALAVVAAWKLPAATTWTGLAAEAVAMGLASLAYCWVLVLRPPDRARWRGRLRALLGGSAA
ncbi:MAG: lipopolysaccharide biosynthesis protein [Terriglobales bacterium]